MNLIPIIRHNPIKRSYIDNITYTGFKYSYTSKLSSIKFATLRLLSTLYYSFLPHTQKQLFYYKPGLKKQSHNNPAFWIIVFQAFLAIASIIDFMIRKGVN